MFGRLRKYHIQARQTVRILVSIFLSDLIANKIGLHEPYWALMTAVIVTQTSIVQTLTTGRDQIVGTLIGASVGILAIMTYREGVSQWVVFSIFLLPLAVLTSIKPSTRLAIVTLVVVFMFPSTGGGPYARPVDRVLAILVGAGVSLVVSYFILHAKSRTDAFELAVDMLKEMKKLLHISMDEVVTWSQIESINQRCIDILNDINMAIKEARQENIGLALEKIDPVLVRLPFLLRRLQSDCLFVARAIDEGAHYHGAPEEFQALKDILNATFDRVIEYAHYQAHRHEDDMPQSPEFGAIRSILPDMKERFDPALFFMLTLLARDITRAESILKRKRILRN